MLQFSVVVIVFVAAFMAMGSLLIDFMLKQLMHQLTIQQLISRNRSFFHHYARHHSILSMFISNSVSYYVM